MRFLIVPLLLLFSILFCDQKNPYIIAVTEGEPSSIVEGCVSAITGDLYLSEEDIIVEGVEPIRLPRFYISGQGKGKFGNWSFSIVQDAIVHPPLGVVEIPERSLQYYHYLGTKCGTKYDITKKKEKHKYRKDTYVFKLDSSYFSKGMTNCSQGEISARANINNNFVHLFEQGDQMMVYGSDGSARFYKRREKHIEATNHYTIIWHLHPNGNKTCYHYGRHGELEMITTRNRNESKVYAWARFVYRGDPERCKDCDVFTSDGKSLYYRFKREGKHKDEFTYFLENIRSSERPEESIHYHDPLKKAGPLLSNRAFPDHRSLQIDYYREGDNIHRVQSLSTQRGYDTRLHTTHRFFYHTGARTTEVLDIENVKTLYRYSHEKRLEAIESYDRNGQLHHKEMLSWGEGGAHPSFLTSKAFFGSDGRPLFVRRFTYDPEGNIIHEEFKGDHSGRQEDETCIRKYSYSQDNRHLLIKEEEPNGRITHYTYHPHSVLITSKKVCDGSKVIIQYLYEYDDSCTLVKEIVDDGIVRKIRVIRRRTAEPFIGMPEVIEERYSDQEILLRKTVLTYSPQGKVIRQDIHDAEGILCYSLHTEYDSFGRPILETNPLGQEIKSFYDSNGNKIRLDEPTLTHFMTYDFSNRLIELKQVGRDGIERITRHRYDTKNNRIATCDPYGNETRFAYDAFGNVIQTTLPPISDASGSRIEPEIHYTYDSAGRKIAETDPDGHTIQTRYNVRNQPALIQHPDGTCEEYVYNLNGTLSQSIDQAGTKTSYTYDILERVISKTIHSSQGELLASETCTYEGLNLVSKTDAVDVTTFYTYDGAGRKIAEEVGGERIEYSYDALGRLHSVRQADLVRISESDLLDRIIEERAEDVNGNVLSRVLYDYDSAGNRTCITRFIDDREVKEFFIYDSLRRLIRKIDQQGESTYITCNDQYRNALGQEVLQKTVTDPMGIQLIETYDALGRIVSSEKRNPFGQTLSLEELFYDAVGNKVKQLSTIFSSQSKRTTLTEWEYSSMRRLTATIEASGSSTSRITRYTYNERGLRDCHIKPDGKSIRYSYNALGAMTDLASSDEEILYHYTYDALGRPLTAEDLNTSAMTFRSYDHRGRIVEETMGSLTLESGYDQSGRRTSLTLPDNSQILYEYTPLALSSVTRINHHGQYTHSYTGYDLSGNVLQEELIAGLGTLTHHVHPLGFRSETASPWQTHRVDGIDPCGHIKELFTSNHHEEVTSTFTYDDLHQVTSESGLFDHQYQYDSHHNRLSKDEANYNVDELNQLHSTDRAFWHYDRNGNPLKKMQDTHDTIYTYDALDRLVCLETLNVRYEFTYDPWHRRLSKNVSTFHEGQWFCASSVRFLYDGDNEIGVVDICGQISELRVLGQGRGAEIGAAIAIELFGQPYAPLHDLFGNITALVSVETGQVAESYSYSTFGEERICDSEGNPLACSGLGNFWRFSSKRIDEETRLIFYGRRYYDPAIGRWLTPDPLHLTEGPNLYAFLLNDPLAHIDLYGLAAELQQAQQGFSFRGLFSKCYESIGRFVRECGQQIPIPRIHQWIQHAGNKMAGSNRNAFQTSKAYTVDGETTSGLENIVVPGMNNSKRSARAMGANISKHWGGKQVTYIYNTTHGFILDFVDYIRERLGFLTSPSKALLGQILASLDNQGRAILWGFSEGTAVIYSALLRLTDEQRDRITVHAFGPGKYISNKLVKDSNNYISDRDFVGLADPAPFISPQDYNVTVLKSGKKLPFDHGFFNDTYQPAVQGACTREKRKYEATH